MCGIAGVMLRRAAAPPEFDELGVMAGALSHRGPDEVGMPRPRPSRARPLPHAFALHLAVRRRCLLDPLRCRWAWANEIAAIFIVRAVQKRSRLGAVARGPLLAASTLAVAALSITVTGSSAIIAAGEVREPQPLTLDMRWSPRAIATTPRYLSTGGSAAVVVSARSEDGEPFEVVVSNLADRDPEGGVRYRAVDLPAGVSATQVSLTTPGGATHSVNRALIDHAASKTELVYWYDLNGRTTAQGPLAKAFAAANAFGLTARGPLLVLVRSERVESSSSAALAQLVAEVARALRPETR